MERWCANISPEVENGGDLGRSFFCDRRRNLLSQFRKPDGNRAGLPLCACSLCARPNRKRTGRIYFLDSSGSDRLGQVSAACLAVWISGCAFLARQRRTPAPPEELEELTAPLGNRILRRGLSAGFSSRSRQLRQLLHHERNSFQRRQRTKLDRKPCFRFGFLSSSVAPARARGLCRSHLDTSYPEILELF